MRDWVSLKGINPADPISLGNAVMDEVFNALDAGEGEGGEGDNNLQPPFQAPSAIVYLAVRKGPQLAGDVCYYAPERDRNVQRAAECAWRTLREQIASHNILGGSIRLPEDYPISVDLATTLVIHCKIVGTLKYVCVALVNRPMPIWQEFAIGDILKNVCDHLALHPHGSHSHSLLNDRLLIWCSLPAHERGSAEHSVLLGADSVADRMDRRAKVAQSMSKCTSRCRWFLVAVATALLLVLCFG